MGVSLKANTTGKPEARKGKDIGQASSCHYKAKRFLKEEEEGEEEEEVLGIFLTASIPSEILVFWEHSRE